MKTILVPTDFSVNANHALRFAVSMAQNTDHKLIFFHTTQTSIPATTPANTHTKIVMQHVEERQKELTSVVDAIYQSMGLTRNEETTTVVVREAPLVVENLVDTAQRHHVDLIIMGTQGATGVTKVLLGSNTVGVIEKAGCPVMVIPADYEFTGMNRIGYASDLTDLKNEAGQIINLVKEFNATLEIFHVYPVSPEKVDISKLNKDNLINELVEAFNYPKIRFHLVPTTRTNDVVGGIESFINIYAPSVLVMFTHKRNFFNKIFNPSRTEEIAFQGKIPLLALKG